MKKLTPLIAFCRKMPHATEDIKWEENLVFSVGGKMFACFNAAEEGQFSFKATPENFARLTALENIIPAPYVGRYHWVALTTPDALPRDMILELLREAHDLVLAALPAKVRKALTPENKGKGTKTGRKPK